MELKKTINSIFVVPTLGIKREDIIDNKLLNGYAWDLNREIKHENSVSLLFKPSDMSKFKWFLDGEYDRSDNIIEDYDYEGGFVVVVYSLNKQFEEDFALIKQGKYSKTSKKFQELFPETLKVLVDNNGRNSYEFKPSLQHRIFKKTDWIKDYWKERINVELTDNMEMWDGYDESKEILDINKIKEVYE